MDISFFKNTPSGYIIVNNAQEADFVWCDSSRDEVANTSECWQKAIYQHCGYHINEYHLVDILNTQHPSYFDLTNDYELLIFRKLFTPLTKDSTENIEITTSPVTFILTDRSLVTVRHANSKTFSFIHQRILQQTESQRSRLPASALDLSLRLLNTMIDHYLELRAPLTKRIEQWQTELLQGSHRFSHWPQLLHENLMLQQLENLCEEQLDALQELRDNYLDQHTDKNNIRHDLMLVRINDLVEHITRVQSHASRMESALKSAVDLHFSATANDTNETMRFLAIITTIFAPLTLLTGIYGMNFDAIPGLHSPDGFWWVLVGMATITTGLLYYFRRRRLVGRGKKSITQLLSHRTKF